MNKLVDRLHSSLKKAFFGYTLGELGINEQTVRESGHDDVVGTFAFTSIGRWKLRLPSRVRTIDVLGGGGDANNRASIRNLSSEGTAISRVSISADRYFRPLR